MFKLIDHKQDILDMYNNNYTPTQISRVYNCYPQCVTNLLKKYVNIKSFRPDKGNVNYFENINSYSKAYILGFIAADGSLVKLKHSSTQTLTITVKYEDKEILEFIKSEIGNEHLLLDIQRRSSFDPTKFIHHIRYTITDSKIQQDLNNLGILPNKSLVMRNIIENIPYEYRDAFIIGYFDGDGSVSLPKSRAKFSKRQNKIITYPSHRITINIRGTAEFLSGLCNHLNIAKTNIKQYDSIPCLSITNKQSIIRFYKCYEGLNFYFKRKHDVFLQRIDHPSYDKYK